MQGLWTLSFLPSKWDYWEIGQLNKLFLFVKYIWNVYIFALESKKRSCCFKMRFVIFSIFLKLFPHISPVIALNAFCHMNNLKDPAGWVINVERSSRWTELWGNINKTGTIFFYYYSWARVFHFKQLLQNIGLE